MSRKARTHQSGTKATSPWRRALQLAQVKPVAAQLKPLARSTAATARRGVHTTRAWAAPQVERMGQVVQDSAAPKVSALLSSAARRLKPAKPPRRRWRKLGAILTLAAAAGVVAAIIRNRRKPEITTSAADAEDETATAKIRDGQARNRNSTNADVNQPVRSS